MTLAVGTHLGPYEIQSAIGAGGMGEVYKARDTRLDRSVAIKVLPPEVSADPDRRARFEREAKTIAGLSHPHICTLYDIGRQDGTDYLVLELLEGETLASRLEKGPLPLADVLRYGIEIASALDAAHRAGIVHRDLKPGNVMLTKSGAAAARSGLPRAMLLDFGLARVIGLGPAHPAVTSSLTLARALTAEGMIVGTFQYMAPEQLEGAEADARSDLWAMGCVLYEMATGRRPFEGASRASLIAAILKEAPRPMPELQPMAPPALEHVVRRCLEKDPEERWQSARDVEAELRWVAESAASTATTDHGGAILQRRLSTMAIGGVALAAVVLAAGLLLAGYTMRREAAPLSFTRLTFQRGTLGNARFAPDGKMAVYSAAWDGNLPELFETRTDISTTRSLGVSRVKLASVSRSGELAVRRSDEGWLVAYESLAVVPGPGIAPRDLMDAVSYADWSPDGKTLAVVRRIGSEDRLEMPPGHVLVKTAGWLADVRVSPDGKSVACTEHSVLFDARGSVVLVDLSGKKTTLTREFADVVGLAWSPQGREIWFTASPSGTQHQVLAVDKEGRMRTVARFPADVLLFDVAPDGRALLATERLQVGIRGSSPANDQERELGWLDMPWPRALSANGATLLFDDLGETGGGNYTIYMRGMDGSPPVRLGAGSGCALSPDGRWVLAIDYGPPHRLMLIPTGTGDSVSLPRGTIETYQSARWLGDDRRILFIGAERGHPQRTWVQDRSGDAPRAVTPEGMAGVAVSPDGKWVAAMTRDSRVELCPIEGGEPRPLAALSFRDEVSHWSADGRTLFVSHGGGHLDVFGIDVRTGVKRLWRTFEVPDPAGVHLSTFVATPDLRGYAYGYMRVLDELYLVEGLK